MSIAHFVKLMRDVRRRSEQLRLALLQSDLTKAFLQYEDACKRQPLGQQVAVVENNVSLQLEATSTIERGRPITAFAGDALVMTVPMQIEYMAAWDGKTGKTPSGSEEELNCHYFVNDGKLHLAVSRTSFPTAYLKFIHHLGAVAISGFAPAEVAVSHIEGPPHAPDVAGIWVKDVTDGSPYDALMQVPEAVATFAQATLNYLKRVQAEANVRVDRAAGQPAVLVAIREIKVGEVLKTGRPPLFWIGNRTYTEKVYEHLARPGLNAIPDTLREMVFGDGAD